MKNKEKYQSAAERISAHEEFCEKHICSDCPCNDTNDCVFKWLELEVEEERIEGEKIEEEKPLPCPFCGGETIVVGTQVFYVLCNDCCGYVSQNESTKSSAIAAHNRVALGL